MSPPTTQLLSLLPPELRNEVYGYLSLPSSTSTTTTGLPLPLKTYTCKHTTVQICAVHQGSSSLLALQPQNVLEAQEYLTHLLSHGVELRIGVTFKGRVNLFVQEHWDKKIEAHLQKLAKTFPWLKKVTRYEVQVLWAPVDGVLKSKKGKTVGGIVGGMVRTLTRLMDADVKKRRGDLKVCLRLEHWLTVEHVRRGQSFGLKEVFQEEEGWSKQTREVWNVVQKKQTQTTVCPGFVSALPVNREENSLLVLDDESVGWSAWFAGTLVARKNFGQITTGDGSGSGADFVLKALVEECMERK